MGSGEEGDGGEGGMETASQCVGRTCTDTTYCSGEMEDGWWAWRVDSFGFERERERESNLVFYTQSTTTVISERERGVS